MVIVGVLYKLMVWDKIVSVGASFEYACCDDTPLIISFRTRAIKTSLV